MESKVSFIDLSKAFSKVSNWNLRKEIFLFKIMNSPILSRLSKKVILYLLKNNLPIEWILKSTVFDHFCGGTSIKECTKTMNRLMQYNIRTILDYSKEHGDENTFDLAVDEIFKTIHEAKNNKNVSFAVFKFTSLADMDVLERKSNGSTTREDIVKLEKIKFRVNELCKTAFENKVKILIDAEHSWIQNTIDEITEEMMILYNKEEYIVYTTIQLYRYDRLAYLKSLHLKLNSHGVKTAVKLVRGAYMEFERERAIEKQYISPIHKTKGDTDRDYNLALQYCLNNIDTIALCAGTHNQDSTELLVNEMEKVSLKKDDCRIYYAQLLGMADNISNILGIGGYNVAKYVPYGKVKEVIPYLFRRADENKSVSGEVSKELAIRKQILKIRNRKT